MGWWHDDGWGWAGLAMMIVMLALWIAVIWAVLAAVRGDTRRGERPDDDPERLLDRRFATGEIDEDEYRRRLDALRSTRRHRTSSRGRPGS